jgi:DNA-binding NarL/FixJ family response regulator
MESLRFIIVDDNQTFRNGIGFFLENVMNHKVVDYAPDGQAFIENSEILQADIILMDVEMPKMNGIDATRKLIELNNHALVIAVTNYEDKAYLSELVGAGFKACVFKSRIYDQLPKAIDQVKMGSYFFPENIAV